MTGTLAQGGGPAPAAGKESVVLCAELRIPQRPICIDLFSGLGGWSEGFIAEGYNCIGFDNHRHEYGDQKYPGQLVIQDVLTLHGSQFRNAAVIVASPPCQNYSYLAMPWSRSTNPDNSKAAKALRLKWETEGPDNRLFDACFRIQREAIEASKCYSCGAQPFAECESCGGRGSRYIPLIVENVRGAIPWVGRSAWNYGSFHLWGDVPALMPINLKRGMKVPGFRFDGSGKSFQTASVEATGQKVPAYSDPQRNGGKGVHLTSPHENSEGLKGGGGGWFHNAETGAMNPSRNPREFLDAIDGTKIGGDWFSDPKSTCRKHGSRSQARKAASAQIAKIPLPLSTHIAQVYKPKLSGASRAENGAAGENQ